MHGLKKELVTIYQRQKNEQVKFINNSPKLNFIAVHTSSHIFCHSVQITFISVLKCPLYCRKFKDSANHAGPN